LKGATYLLIIRSYYNKLYLNPEKKYTAMYIISTFLGIFYHTKLFPDKIKFLKILVYVEITILAHLGRQTPHEAPSVRAG